jgi:predicted Rossmann-fold nucleotide-binding protein
MFAKGKKEGFIHTEDDTLWNVADTPEEAVELLLN